MLKVNLSNTKPDKTKLVKKLADGNILAPFLDRAFDDFDEPFEFKYEPKGHDDAWHPSGDCLPTVSELWVKAKGLGSQREPSGSLRKTFMVGHYWHQLLQYIVVEKLRFAEPTAIERNGSQWWGEKVIPQSDMTLNSQGHPRPYHWVRGSADIAPLTTKKWTGLVDFKTMATVQFNQPTVPEWAADKYRCQLNIYMELFDMERAMILAVNKDSGAFKEFQYVRDQPLIDAIIEKWKFVSELLDHEAEPTPEDDAAFVLPL